MVGDHEYAVRGCGLLGVYRCVPPPSGLTRARARLAGNVGQRDSCRSLRQGEAAYRAAVGDWRDVQPAAEASSGGETGAPLANPSSTDGEAAAPEPRADQTDEPVEAAVRARLDAASQVILACAGTDMLALRVRWDVDCVLSVEPRHPDPQVTGCVQAALPEEAGGLRCDAPGELLHVVHAAPSSQPESASEGDEP